MSHNIGMSESKGINNKSFDWSKNCNSKPTKYQSNLLQTNPIQIHLSPKKTLLTTIYNCTFQTDYLASGNIPAANHTD